MSGGRYAPAKAPERRCMPLIQWPAADRQLWEDALTLGTILDDHLGARAHLSVTSNRKTERGYGRFLTYCHMHDVTRNADFDAPIDIEAVKAIVTREGRMERPASIIDIERELVPQKQQLDFEHSAEFMLFLIARLQKPIDLWLANAANNSGGRPMNIVRNVVLFYLIKDAPAIIGEEPSTDSTFMELCDQVTFYCGIAEQGLLERVRRIMKKQESGLAWSRHHDYSRP